MKTMIPLTSAENARKSTGEARILKKLRTD
jgi:hypothetical protein